jgi:GDPmannose 4,6-dehydratase
MWRVLQQETPDDYVLATGTTYSVREFVELAFAEVGLTIAWRGEGVNEQGFCASSGRTLVKVDPIYFRPTEVDLLVGNPTKAMRKLGWRSTTTLHELVAEMVAHDIGQTKEQSAGASTANQAMTEATHRVR